MRLANLKKTNAYLSLIKDLQNNKLNHAYLIIGEDALTRRLFHKLAAVVIMCKKGGCLECADCKRIFNGNHVDVKFTEINRKMKVEDINELVEDTQTNSIEGGRKLYFIDNAETMSIAIQNKLLKTYEEPNRDIVLFLSASNESGILPTIKSRAKKLFIKPFSPETIINELIENGVDRESAEVAAAYAEGSMERAERITEDEEYKNTFIQALDVLSSLKNSKRVVDFIFLPIFNKDNIKLTLDFLEIIISDVLIINSGADISKKIMTREYDMNVIKENFSPAGAATAIFSINEGRKMLQYNVNATSVAEKILFDILEAKYKWQ